MLVIVVTAKTKGFKTSPEHQKGEKNKSQNITKTIT